MLYPGSRNILVKKIGEYNLCPCSLFGLVGERITKQIIIITLDVIKVKQRDLVDSEMLGGFL